MKKSLFGILLAGAFISLQAQEMWHVAGTNNYLYKQCLQKINIVEDSVTGVDYYFPHLSKKKEASVLSDLYHDIFDRMVQTGSLMPSGNGDIQGVDEGSTGFYRSMWLLNELPGDGGWWTWADVGIESIQQCTRMEPNSIIHNAYLRLLYNLTQQNLYLHIADSLQVNAAERAQVRFVHALTAWYLLDLFPSSHFTTQPRIDGNTQMSRQQLYSWLEGELMELTTLLPKTRTDIYEVDADAANMLLARLYLNAEVYTGTAQWTKAAQYARLVMNGQHKLHTTGGTYSAYQELFMGDNDANGAQEEVLFMLKQDGKTAYSWGGSIFTVCISRDGTSMPFFGAESSWAGWRAGYRLLRAFATAGQLGSLEGTEFTMPAKLSDDRALFYADKNYPIPTMGASSDFNTTWSVNKFTGRYSTDPMDCTSSASAGSPRFPDTDLPLIRSAEAWLTYAEAQYRLGHTSDARDVIAELRSRAHAQTPASISIDYILDEWLREFYSEGRRRVDLVRFGQFASPNATRTWEGHADITDTTFNTYDTPNLIKYYPRFDNKIRYFAQLVNIHDGEIIDANTGSLCDSCNTGETYWDVQTNTSYSINYATGDYNSVGAFRTLYPVEPGDTVELELTDFPYKHTPAYTGSLPAVSPKKDAFTIMLHSNLNYGSDLVVLGDYINADREWIYSTVMGQPRSHTTSGTNLYSQNFTRMESVGNGWYKAEVYPIPEKDDNNQTLSPGYARISGIGYQQQGALFKPVSLTDVHKISGVVNAYTEKNNGQFEFYFSQPAYYDDPTYGRIFYASLQTDRVIFMEDNASEIPSINIPAVSPTAGAVTLVIKFDKAPCEGYDVIFVGQYDGCYWDFATAYKFESIGDGWYKIVLRPDTDGTIIGRPFQGKKGQSDWQYCWSNLMEDIVNYGGDNVFQESGLGETNLYFDDIQTQASAVIYLESKKWNQTPCEL
ncbi:MAG: RagB/SusD family nutrient uptake outer membrane protein [Paludibacteraceae bacterium]|nr:RagB/SusD family nutrient uptake outer membrane protein [Paludibacteraceae bacterium]